MKKPGERGYLREWCIAHGLPPELGDAVEADLDRRERKWELGWRAFVDSLRVDQSGLKGRAKGGGLKVLSVRQPWATLIIEYGKIAENRSEHFPKNYLGPLVIASSAIGEPARDSVEHTIKKALSGNKLQQFNRKWEKFNHRKDSEDFPLGKIIGIVDWYKTYDGKERCPSKWGDNWEGVIQLMLRYPQKLDTPIPAKGRLGLWDPPEEAVPALQELMRKWPKYRQKKLGILR